MKENSSSRNGHSRKWPDYDTFNSSKCKDNSGWPSWECFQENKDMQNDDTIDREAHKVSNKTFDEQRGQNKIWKRDRSRSRQREYSKSRSRSPCNGLRQASGILFENRSVSEKTSRRCRDFAAGKCSRGSRCKFLHHGYLNNRHRDHPRNELTDKSLEGKSFSEDSCRYSHHRSSGEEYDRRNKRIDYDQNVEPLVIQNDIGHCKFFSSERCYQNDCRFSHDVGRVTTGLDAAKTKKGDDVCSLDRPKAELSRRGENEIKSEKCSAWDKYASELEKPKETTGWGKWPGKPDNHIWNSSSHDYPGGEKTRLNQKSFQHETKLSGRGKHEIMSEKCLNQKSYQHETKLFRRGEDEIKSEKCSAWDKYASELEKPKDTTSWGKWPGKPDNHIWNSSSHDYPGGEKTRLNQKSFQHETKLSGRGEDEIKSEKCSAWDKFASELEKPKDTTGWGKWPGKSDNYIWNSSSPDYPGGEKTRLNHKSFQHETKLSGRGEDEIKSEKCSAWDKFASELEKPKDTTNLTITFGTQVLLIIPEGRRQD
ncbi:uncharacterized protein LOC141714214 [Apium graveolens]|uniref:uncharacterized protein LOC141714214 n=1 Tax=Apium graveolens TaxID=4045 RepID=UPI003D7B29B1